MSLSLSLSKALECLSPKVHYEDDVQANIRWCVCAPVCILQENRIFHGCLSGLGELSGGGGCSWGFLWRAIVPGSRGGVVLSTEHSEGGDAESAAARGAESGGEG